MKNILNNLYNLALNEKSFAFSKEHTKEIKKKPKLTKICTKLYPQQAKRNFHIIYVFVLTMNKKKCKRRTNKGV